MPPIRSHAHSPFTYKRIKAQTDHAIKSKYKYESLYKVAHDAFGCLLISGDRGLIIS